MRVLYLSASGQLGGAERVLLDMVDACTRAGLETCVVQMEPGPLAGRVRRAGGTSVELASAALAGIGEHERSAAGTLAHALRSSGSILGSVFALRRVVREWSPDLVHANGVKMHLLAAYLGARPLVWHVHDYISRRAASASLLKWHARRAAVVITPSDDVAADAQQALGRDQVLTLHNGVNVDVFNPEGPALDLDTLAGIGAERTGEPGTGAPAAASPVVRVGLVATYARWKGHETFLQALSFLPPSVCVRAYIIGGPLYSTARSQQTRARLEHLVDEFGLTGRVGFLGFVDDPAPAYRALDVVVHASTAPEPFGLVVAEAMAAGRAVIAADHGGVREVVGNGTVLLHGPGDAAALGRAIERLSADAELRASLGRAARAHIVTEFSRARFDRALLELYARVLGRNVAAPLREAV